MTLEDLFDSRLKHEGLLLIMQKCQACGCYFFKSKDYNLCQDCREKNKKGTGLMTRYIEKMKRG